MGAMLGQYSDTGRYSRDSLLGFGEERAALLAGNVFPNQAAIKPTTWKKIREYYLDQAPDSLTLPVHPSSSKLDLFELQRTKLALSPPSTTLTRIGQEGDLYVGDANSGRLYVLGPDQEFKGAAQVGEGLTDLYETENALYLTVMGSFSPTNQPTGYFMQLPMVPGQKPRVLIDKLHRPVQSTLGDFNDDGRTDVVICEFGKWVGRLAWYAQREDGSFERHLLRAKPGATQTYVLDWDSDGDPDIMALMAQGDEGIFYYENDGKGNFVEKTVMSFPPSYGSSYFQLADLDLDGKLDILYVNGDNADYLPVVKPYHGIHVYLNRSKQPGALAFKRQSQLWLPGAYRVLPGDFDLDGDVDLAAIAFFPNFQADKIRSFVWYENMGNLNFEPHEPRDLGRMGRFVTMSQGDLDDDGDADLMLGSLTFEVPGDSSLVKQWVRAGVPYLVLENTRY